MGRPWIRLGPTCSRPLRTPFLPPFNRIILPFLHPRPPSLTLNSHSFFSTYTLWSFQLQSTPFSPSPSSFLRASFAFPLLFRQQQPFFGILTAELSLAFRATPDFVWPVQHSWIPPPPFDSRHSSHKCFPPTSCAARDSTSSGSRQADRPLVPPCDTFEHKIPSHP